MLFEGADRVPVRGSGVVLRRGTGVQGYCGNPGILCLPGGVEEGDVVLVDPHPHLDRHRDIRGAGRLDGRFEDLAEQLVLPRQGRSPAAAGDLGNRATEVEIDVVGVVFFHEHPHCCVHRRRIHSVQLDAAHVPGLGDGEFGRVMGDHP